MDRVVFKGSFFRVILLPIIIFMGFTLLFIVVYDIEDHVPLWMLLFYIIPLGFAVGGQTDKVVVDGDMLRYEHGVFIKNKEEISLKQVSMIEIRTVEEYVEDSDGSSTLKRKRYAYVLDDVYQEFFSFKADFISNKNRQRFENAVIAVNPEIEVLDYDD